MEDLFKKFIYTGVGWVSNTTEKLKKHIDDFITEGKLSAEDGKKLVEEFIQNSESKKAEIEDQFNKLIDNLMKSMTFVTVEDLKKLERRVSVLEKSVNKKEEKKEKKKDKKKTSKDKNGKNGK